MQGEKRLTLYGHLVVYYYCVLTLLMAVKLLGCVSSAREATLSYLSGHIILPDDGVPHNDIDLGLMRLVVWLENHSSRSFRLRRRWGGRSYKIEDSEGEMVSIAGHGNGVDEEERGGARCDKTRREVSPKLLFVRTTYVGCTYSG